MTEENSGVESGVEASADVPVAPERGYAEREHNEVVDRLAGTDARGSGAHNVLPGGVIIGDQLVREFEVRAMDGDCEDALASEGSTHSVLSTLVRSCLVRLGDETKPHVLARQLDGMLAVDREVLLVAIRRATLGSEWFVNLTCPGKYKGDVCGNKWRVALNLAGLVAGEMANPMVREFEFDSSVGVVKWHSMTSGDQGWVSNLFDEGGKEAKRALLTNLMLSRIDAIDSKVMDRDRESSVTEVRNLLRRMPMMERHRLRDDFKAREPSFDTTLQAECKRCGHKIDEAIPMGRGFFLPQETSPS